jgi:hypothetical protein
MDSTSYKQMTDCMVDFCRNNRININEIPELIEKLKVDVLRRLVEHNDGLYVLKKKGHVEKFDEDKLFLSIGNASDEIEEPLTSGDIHNIVRNVLKILNNSSDKLIPSSDIREAVLNTLSDMAFFEVYKNYKDYASGR